MPSKPVLIIAGIVLILFFSGCVEGTSIRNWDEWKASQKGMETPDILKKINANGNASIIVTLKGNEYTSPTYAQNLDLKKEEIKKIQDRVLAKLGPEDFTLTYQLENSPILAGTVTLSGFQKLLADEDVIIIELDQSVYATGD
jgi:hypothetical protein